jgi:hypothetical protein
MSLVSINHRNLFKLVTHEDVFNVHKTLGVVCLSHFLVRMACLCIYGNMLFTREWTDVLLLLFHLFLSLSSLIFVIPKNRNKAFIVIWPEFRMHSILFASRSIACIFLDLLVSDKNIVRMGTMLIVVTTMALADVVSDHHQHLVGGRTTMRGMSWPDRFPWNEPLYQKAHNLFYSFSQIGATLLMVDGTLDEKFMVLLPIQIAPFLSTLVKKGIVQNSHWHIVYTLSLLLPYLHGVSHHDRPFPSSHRLMIMSAIALFRFVFHANKYLLWTTLFWMIWMITT